MNNKQNVEQTSSYLKDSSKLFNQNSHNNLYKTCFKQDSTIFLNFEDYQSPLEKQYNPNINKKCNFDINDNRPGKVLKLDSNISPGIFTRSQNQSQHNRINKNQIQDKTQQELYQNQNYQELKQRYEEYQFILDKIKQKYQKLKIKKIFMEFLNNTPSRRFHKLTKYHFDILNDKVHYYNHQKQSKYHLHIEYCFIFKLIQVINSQFTRFLKKRTIYRPESNIVFFYDLIAIIFISCWMFIYSMHLFFGTTYLIQLYVIQFMLVISNLFFASEFILRFQIGFYKSGKFITDRREIANQYIKSSMVYDILGFLAQIYNFVDNSLSIWTIIFELLFFLKYKSLGHTFNRLEKGLYLKGFKSHPIELLKMLLQLAVMAHCIASVWHILSVLQIDWYNEDNTWLHVMDLLDKSWIVRYLESFYWAVATVMLVGSKGETPIETFFTTFTLLWTVGVFAYLISKISMIIEELNKQQQDYKRDLEKMNKYMEQKNIDYELQSKVRSFLEYIYQASEIRNITSDAQEVLQKLPAGLQEDISTQINQNILMKFPLMWHNFTKSTQDEILLIMSEKTFVTNEFIFRSKEIEQPSMYFILKGKVAIQQAQQQQNINNQEVEIAHLQEGEIIGDVELLKGVGYQYSVKCLSFVTACQIKRQDFLKIISQNQEDFQKFMNIKDQVINQGYSQYYKRQCKICNSSFHTEIDCNLIVYRPNKFLKSLKYAYDTKCQQRHMYLRTNNIRFKALNRNLLFDLNLTIQRLQLDEATLEYAIGIQTESSSECESSDQDETQNQGFIQKDQEDLDIKNQQFQKIKNVDTKINQQYGSYNKLKNIKKIQRVQTFSQSNQKSRKIKEFQQEYKPFNDEIQDFNNKKIQNNSNFKKQFTDNIKFKNDSLQNNFSSVVMQKKKSFSNFIDGNQKQQDIYRKKLQKKLNNFTDQNEDNNLNGLIKCLLEEKHDLNHKIQTQQQDVIMYSWSIYQPHNNYQKVLKKMRSVKKHKTCKKSNFQQNNHHNFPDHHQLRLSQIDIVNRNLKILEKKQELLKQ